MKLGTKTNKVTHAHVWVQYHVVDYNEWEGGYDKVRCEVCGKTYLLAPIEVIQHGEKITWREYCDKFRTALYATYPGDRFIIGNRRRGKEYI